MIKMIQLIIEETRRRNGPGLKMDNAPILEVIMWVESLETLKGIILERLRTSQCITNYIVNIIFFEEDTQ